MRSRNIKPGLFKNELLGSADPLMTILFEGLWCMADREGRLEDRPLRVCAEVFPYRRSVSEKQCDKLLSWLHNSNFIHRYEVDGKRFIQVLSFWKHQRPHSKEKPSEIPPLTTIRHQPNLDLGAPQGSTKVSPEPEKGRAENALIPDSGFLIPESLLRKGNVGGKDVGNRSESGAKGTNPSSTDFLTLTDRCRSAYPAGTYTDANWLMAEREMQRLVGEGTDPESLVEAATSYAAQAKATQRTGTQWVKSPEKFYGRDGHWRGPFKIPPPDPKREAELVWLQVRPAIGNTDLRKHFPADSRAALAVAAIGGWHALGMRSTEKVDTDARFEFIRAFVSLAPQASAA